MLRVRALAHCRLLRHQAINYNKFFIIVHIEVHMYTCVDMLILSSDYTSYVTCYMFFLKFYVPKIWVHFSEFVCFCSVLLIAWLVKKKKLTVSVSVSHSIILSKDHCDKFRPNFASQGWLSTVFLHSSNSLNRDRHPWQVNMISTRNSPIFVLNNKMAAK